MHFADQPPILEDLVPGSQKLFLFFGGIWGNVGMPPFEFYRAANILDYSKIFIRDLNQSWYQRGLPGIGDDAYAVGDYLRGKIQESGTSDVCFVGNSMGGYGALLFCAMLQLGRAIAFVPQTFVSREKRQLHGDERWPDQIGKLHDTATAADILDLKPWIQSRFPTMQASVFVSTWDSMDMAHANELEDFQNIEVRRFHEVGHGLVKKFRDDGSLERILHTSSTKP